MLNRRDMMQHSAVVTGLLASAGLLPGLAQAQAANRAAFDAKSMDEMLKAMGLTAKPVESKEVTLTGPDIAENGAVVPWAWPARPPASSACCCWWRRTPACWPALST